MGLVLQKLNVHTAARQQFELAMDDSDGTSYAPMAFGHALLREGSYSAARENLQRAFNKQANRSDDIALENGISLGLSMLAQSDWTAAVPNF
jgi:Tfp pilus assembly protein PilF